MARNKPQKIFEKQKKPYTTINISGFNLPGSYNKTNTLENVITLPSSTGGLDTS